MFRLFLHVTHLQILNVPPYKNLKNLLFPFIFYYHYTCKIFPTVFFSRALFLFGTIFLLTSLCLILWLVSGGLPCSVQMIILVCRYWVRKRQVTTGIQRFVTAVPSLLGAPNSSHCPAKTCTVQICTHLLNLQILRKNRTKDIVLIIATTLV